MYSNVTTYITKWSLTAQNGASLRTLVIIYKQVAVMCNILVINHQIFLHKKKTTDRKQS